MAQKTRGVPQHGVVKVLQIIHVVILSLQHADDLKEGLEVLDPYVTGQGESADGKGVPFDLLGLNRDGRKRTLHIRDVVGVVLQHYLHEHHVFRVLVVDDVLEQDLFQGLLEVLYLDHDVADRVSHELADVDQVRP